MAPLYFDRELTDIFIKLHYQGIYRTIDDVIVIGLHNPYHHSICAAGNILGTLVYNSEEKPRCPRAFRAPFSVIDNDLEFFVLLPAQNNPNLVTSGLAILDRERRPVAEPERDLTVRYVYATREPFFGNKNIYYRLLVTIDLLPVDEDRPVVTTYREPYMIGEEVPIVLGTAENLRVWISRIVQMVRRELGELYPLPTWSIQGNTISHHPTWRSAGKPIFQYQAIRTAENGGIIDLYPLDDKGKPKSGTVLRGIYYILDDFVLLCYNDWRSSGLAKQERPQRFMRTKEKPYTVEVLRRLHEQDIRRSTKRDQLVPLGNQSVLRRVGCDLAR